MRTVLLFSLLLLCIQSIRIKKSGFNYCAAYYKYTSIKNGYELELDKTKPEPSKDCDIITFYVLDTIGRPHENWKEVLTSFSRDRQVQNIRFTKSSDGYLYDYRIDVKGRGAGIFRSSLTLKFTDGEPDTYSLSLIDTKVKNHSLKYKSKDPIIRKIKITQ